MPTPGRFLAPFTREVEGVTRLRGARAQNPRFLTFFFSRYILSRTTLSRARVVAFLLVGSANWLRLVGSSESFHFSEVFSSDLVERVLLRSALAVAKLQVSAKPSRL